ncbi:MAG: glycosyltransferase [bacterium]
MQKDPWISVILPNYNEANNLKRGVLTEINDFLLTQSYSFEVIISDDGSSDNSLEIVDKFVETHPAFRIIHNQHAGKPFALRSAIKEAKGKYVLFSDMDQSTPIGELAKLTPWAEQGYKIVIGSRGAKRSDTAIYRQVASIIFLMARRLIILPEIKDTQCGFKLVDRELAKKIFANLRILGRASNTEGWKVTAYDVEMLFLAKKMGAEIKEVRVAWKNEDTSTGKSRNFVKESVEMLLEILRVRVNEILGKYHI